MKGREQAGFGGRNAQAVRARDAEFVTPSHTRLYPFVPDRGEGCWVWDVDGRKYLDFTAGIAVLAAGHAHPKITSAIAAQAAKLAHFSAADFYEPNYATLAQRLAQLAPMPGAKKVFLCNSGAEAIEAAIKLARWHTKRQRLIAFDHCFHGRTLGALALTASKLWQQRGFGPTLAGVEHVPFCSEGLDYLEDTLFRTRVPPEEVAAVFFEPVQGEGGLRTAEPGFLPRLRSICNAHGILLIADEVQTGLGRTGTIFSCEHWGVAPDIACLAKALGGGLPLGAMIARAEVMDWPRGAHTSTFGGNPVACAAAMALLDLLEGGLLAQAREIGAHLRAGLDRFAQTHGQVGEVRGLGMMLGFTLPSRSARDAFLQRAFEHGLLLLGSADVVVRLTPPLTLTREEADRGLAILDQVLGEFELKEAAA